MSTKNWNIYAEHRDYYRDAAVKQGQKTKLLVFSNYSLTTSPSCAICGVDDIDVLCIDHVNNNGAEHRKKTGNGITMYRWLKKNKYPVGYQVLCFNCNMKKQIMYYREVRNLERRSYNA